MGEYEVNEADIPPSFKKTRVEEATFPGLRCKGCGHEWQNQVEQPKYCPECKAQLIHEDSGPIGAVSEGDDEGEVSSGNEIEDLLNESNNDDS